MTGSAAIAETAAHSPIAEWCQQVEQSLGSANIGSGDWDTIDRAEQYQRLEAIVGNTALLPVPELSGIWAKQEYTNPSGSHYDRVSLPTLRLLEEQGLIHPGDELRDITSGSGGISLALFSKLLGYKARISLPDELTADRIYPMEYFGAEIVRTGPGYVQAMSNFQAVEIMGMIRSGEWKLSRNKDPDIESIFFMHHKTNQHICYVNHSQNSISLQGHQQLGREIVKQAPEVPRAVILAIGNWTTIAGIAPIIRGAWPTTEIIGVKPADDADQTNYGLVQPGLTIPFRFKDPSLLTGDMVISDDQREKMRTKLNTDRAVTNQVGNSSLLCLAAAQAIQASRGGSIITINYDQAMRY